MDKQHIIAWCVFLAFVLVMLAVDLLVLHRKPREIQWKEALVGALLPMVMAVLFIGVIYWAYESHFLNLGVRPGGLDPAIAERYYPTTGYDAGLVYFTGYMIELTLSADNVLLFVILLSFFKVPRELQHRVLFWGVIGAIGMRGLMVVGGSVLLAWFGWMVYVFGAFLLLAAWKMLASGQEPSDPTDNWAIRLVQGIVPIQPGYVGKRFFTRVNGAVVGTSLLLVLICIEFTDLVFAMDSIPAIFGITRDTFIVFTSNVFAILGLRSMYFLLAGVMERFHYLKIGLGIVLGFVGMKMLLPGVGTLYGRFVMGGAAGNYHWEIDKYLSLALIIGVLLLAVAASWLFPPRGQGEKVVGAGSEGHGS